MRPLHHALALAGFCAGVGASGIAMAATYKVTPVDIFGATTVVPSAMNAKGDFTGYYSNPGQMPMAFVYRDGVATAIGPTKPDRQSNGKAINKKGLVVLDAWYATTNYAYLYKNGKRQALEGLPGRDTGGDEAEIEVTGIANDGSIVGNTWSSLVHSQAWKQVAGVVTPLMSSSASHSVAGLNNQGQAVGWIQQPDGSLRGFLQDSTGFTVLPGVPGEDYSAAVAISESGHVLGETASSTPSLSYQPYLYRNGVMTMIDKLGSTSFPAAINGSDQVVGSGRMANGQSHGFLWENGSTQDLNTLLDPLTGAGWTITGATAINDKGVILCMALDTTGALRAVLLKPMK